MSLVNRVSAFFLVALAVILAIYSVTMYVLVSQQLHRQFERQLHAALHQLTAAVEVEEDDVKFEPSDHTIHLGSEDGLEDIRWAIFDEAGKIVTRSQNITPGKSLDDELLKYGEQLHQEEHADSLDLGNWRVLQHRLAAEHPKPIEERDALERAALVVTVGRSPEDLNANLRWVSLLVIVLPIGTWLIAAVVGHRFCAAALRPVRTMADDAREMSLASTNGQFSTERIPVAKTGDELAELGVAFNAVLDELFKTLGQQRRFTGDAAHQLRTPLAAIRGQIEVALRRPRTAEEHARTLSVLLEQTTEMQQVVESLLFLARAEGEAAAPTAEQISLKSWLPSFLQRFEKHPRATDLHFQSLQPAEITASPALLSQLLENLVSNALKYSEPGTPVTVEVRQSKHAAIIAVQDQGIGIPASERTAIFEPFFRSPNARKAGIAGTGLGLAIAARIATALGGELTCEPVDGPGSCFVLRLPSVGAVTP
ncbi:sensor histidine kinase [Anatilimnocola floriformis]|uniref:sensor histidine kinase n=1 Tax=Anatilimnocola floriformis TaxID=2948575 RepID=UPI0020C20683|nr:ATP-binding protein [Anatilimnocola floriformis]